MHSSKYTMYGAELSYFSGKVRAYLRWKALPYEEVLASAEVYRDVIFPRVGFPVIPVLVCPSGETLQDSSEIIDTLEQRHGGASIYPTTPAQRLASAMLELYADEWLLIPAMHYRWHHNREFAIRGFGALIVPNASPEEQLAVGAQRAAPFARAAVLLGAEPHMHSAIERSYEALLGELDLHFASRPYLLGTRPCMGDFALFGPLYAHQYRDPASGDLMRRLAPNLVQWVERMRQPPPHASGEFSEGDEVPDSLIPVMARMFREQFPVLADTERRLRAWLEANPGSSVPRAIGSHSFELEGARGTRGVRPYSLWMLQRVLDVYRAFDQSERASAHRFLNRIQGGLAALLNLLDLPRLDRDGLSVAPARSA